VTVGREAALLAIVVAAASLTGCGGNGGNRAETPAARTTAATTTPTGPLGKRAYVKKLQHLGRRLGKSVDGLYPIDTGTRGSETSRRTVEKLQKAHVVLEDVLAELMRIVPPSRVASAHHLLEAGVRGIAADVAAVIKDLRTGNLAASIGPSGLPSLPIITAATDAMEKKGFDVLARQRPG
jgi:hypothetical protein